MFINGIVEENRKYWYIESKHENDSFYVRVLIFSLFASFFIVIIEAFTYYVVRNKIVVHSVSIILLIEFILYINSIESVRLGMLRVRKSVGRLLVDLPIIILTLGMSVSVWTEKTTMLMSAIIIVTFILEIVGLVKFHYSYTVYKFSYANITLNTQDIIIGIEVDKIKKKGKWLIIQEKDRERTILFDAVNNIDYYGEQKYVYHKW